MSSAEPGFEIARIFGVRPTGVAFEVVARLGTPAIANAARELLVLDAEVDAAIAEALTRLPTVEDRGSRDRVWKKLTRRVAPGPRELAALPLDRLVAAFARVHAARPQLDELIVSEYGRLHHQLVIEARRELPDFLLIESGPDGIDRLKATDPTAMPKSQDRRNDRTLALYLQRVCVKNDTVSRFGPVAWGSIVPGIGVRIEPAPGIAARHTELELWVVKGVIGLLNAEPEVRPEVSPRLHPHGLVTAGGFARLDEDRELPLTDAERALVLRCDGQTAAHALGDPSILALLASLAERGVIRWELEPMALDIAPLASLAHDVAGWRDTPLRACWQARIAALAAYGTRFAADPSVSGRRAILAGISAALEALAIDKPEHRRTLYAARNPISENCYQAGTFTLGDRSVEALVADASPWFELFGDAVALTGSRVFERLRELISIAPRRDGVLSYSTLARVARQHGPGITDDALAAEIARTTWDDIKRELGAVLADRADAPEWQLSAEDCRFLRRNHRFRIGGDLTVPSADLQVLAASPEDAAAGRLEWLIAELHFGPALLQHSTYWCCPDKPALAASLAHTADGRAFSVRDAGNGIPVHVSGEAVMTAIPDPVFVGVGRPKPAWHAVRPAEARVVVDEERGDVRLQSASGTDLGSLVRTPRMIMGLHPFFPFERVPHAPRLRVGNVIVQRRAWRVAGTDLAPDRPAGVSAAFVLAIERARAARDIPRWVFLRPAPDSFGDRGLLTRDKDNKPLYIDLESVVYLDILERRLRKYGNLVLTEMLPAPHQMIWHQPEGRYSFELRTNVLPR
ncbi:MAG: hypothetical protein WKG01_03380 [Kofleriaceae bacterium]